MCLKSGPGPLQQQASADMNTGRGVPAGVISVGGKNRPVHACEHVEWSSTAVSFLGVIGYQFLSKVILKFVLHG
jgi:hypothetical protein